MTLVDVFDLDASLAAVGRQTAEGAQKVWEDLERYDRVIAQTHPAVIVECGTGNGKSARWFASHDVDVVTIDATEVTIRNKRVVTICGDTTSPETVERVREIVDGRSTMVVLDSDHSAAQVHAEIGLYGPLVTEGCYLVVEDGIVRWMNGYTSSPLDAIERLLVDNPEWERARKIEALHPVSMFPAGWWIKTEEGSCGF